MRLNKYQLDFLGTVFGAIAGVATVLISSGYLNPKLGGAIAGVSTVLLGVVSNKPANASPDTSEAEEESKKD